MNTHLLDRARFDARTVAAGIAILVVGVVVGFVMLAVSSRQAADVAQPVAALCREGGAAAAELAEGGACDAAGDVETGVGPFQSEANPAVQGARGVRGIPGVPGEPGVGLPGRPGEPGAVGGMGPPGTPGQPGADSTAAGPEGEPGAEGPAGEPGADSVVAGPQGPQGPPGANSTVPGPQGPPGESIVGPPGPVADQQTFVTDDGRTFLCDRSGGDDMAPTYSCSQVGEMDAPEETS